MEDFWIRVKQRIKKENTTMDWVAHQIGVRPDSFRRWAQRSTLPNAAQANGLASALGTTVEYLVTGKEPFYLSTDEIAFANRAKRWRTVIDDLETLSPAMAEGFRSNIHIAAEEARGSSTGVMDAGEGKGA